MRRCTKLYFTPKILVLFLAVWITGCPENIPIQPQPAGQIEAVFDPASTPANVPTPTDLAKNPATGLLNVPVADIGKVPAQATFDKYLNMLDGYPVQSTAVVRFNGELDPTTVNSNTIKVFAVDLSDPNAPQITAVDSEKLTFRYVYEASSSSTIVKINHPGGWDRATTYVVFVLGGENGVKDKNGNPVIRSALFEIAATPNPICEWDLENTWDSTTKTCTTALAGTTAQGCCTKNYSTLLASTVEKTITAQIQNDPANADKTEEEIEELIHSAMASTLLDKATQFEKLHQVYNSLLNIGTNAGLTRDNVAVVWAFTTVRMTEIEFDPTIGKTPYPPGDMVMKNGKVNLPEQTGETASEKALREALNTLDGFSTTATNAVPVAGSIDATSVNEGSAVLILNLTNPSATAPTMTFAYNPSANAITATPVTPLVENTQYAIVMFSKLKSGSKEADSGLADENGNRLVSSSVFALAKSPYPLIDSTETSTVSVLDNDTAKALEGLRLALSPLFSALDAKGMNRDDIIMAWTFTTQTITSPLTQLRALPWQILATLDSNQPQFSGTNDPDLIGFPQTAPRDSIGAWIPDGIFTSWNALDPTTGAFLTDPTQGTVIQIPFYMTVPTTASPTNGYPVVVFQHGLTRAKADMFAIANTLASAGFATIAFDVIYHGSRTWCTMDSHCNTGGTCDVSTGECSTGLLDSDSDGVPDASGGPKFMNTNNPFGVRDAMRQHVIDAASLLRAIKLGASQHFTGAGAVTLDEDKVYIVSQSLGSILSTLVLATDSLPKRAVLNVPGGPWGELMSGTKDPVFQKVIDDLLASSSITRGSFEALQLFSTFQWILDPADPANFAPYLKPVTDTNAPRLPDLITSSDVTGKNIMVQVAGQDLVIPTSLQQHMADLMYLPTTQTTYANADHGFLLDPTNDAALTEAAQTQVVKYLLTGNICTPDTTAGTCN